jgi:adenine-specific DNA-methyltransferase
MIREYKMAKKKAVSKKAAEKQKSLKKRSGDASPTLETQPRAAMLQPSAVVDTRVVYCGDNLEQLKKLPDGCVKWLKDAYGLPEPKSCRDKHRICVVSLRKNGKIKAMKNMQISSTFSIKESVVLYEGDCLDLLRQIPDNSIQLIATSPPYNIGKEYEKRQKIKDYIEQQAEVISCCTRLLSEKGSICWQVGNYVDQGAIIPLDTILYPVFERLGLVLRNRIIWRFEHGLHCSKRFSGRYETILWFTRKTNDYTFNLDPVRIPQKYPGKKYFKGPKAGQYSCNPLGKNPGDVWDIPNVKSNHIEKTEHPCQFPVELIERLVLSLTNENDWILDPFAGTGTTIIAAVMNHRKGMGAEIEPKYVKIAKNRIHRSIKGQLKTRSMHKPIYDPAAFNNKLTIAPWSYQIMQQKELF